MAVEYKDKIAKLGFLQQSKSSNHWAAPQAANANFVGINAEVGVTIEPGVTVDEFAFTGTTGLMKEADRRYVDGISPLQYLSYKVIPTKTNLAAHLIAAFQKVSEGAATPYVKDISPVNADVDFANNNGFLWTLAHSASGNALQDGVILENALIDTLGLKIDNLANGVKRLASLDVKWVGNEMNFNQNLNGTWVAAPTNTATFFNSKTLGFTLNITVGSTALTAVCWRAFEMQLNNNVSNPCPTVGGKANNYRLNPTLRFVIDIPYTTDTKAIVGSFKDGDKVNFDFGNGAGTSDGQILLTVAEGVLTKSPLEIQNEYHALRLEIEADKPTAGFAASFIKFADAVDGGY